jgi:hypothetical protein
METGNLFSDISLDIKHRKNDLDSRGRLVKRKILKYKDAPIVKMLLEMDIKQRYNLLEYLWNVDYSNSLDSMEGILFLYEECLLENGEHNGELIYVSRRGVPWHSLYLKGSDNVPNDRFYKEIKTENELVEILSFRKVGR